MGSHLYSKTFVLAVVALGMALSLVEPAFAQDLRLFRLLSLVLACPLWRFWAADTGSFESFASAVSATDGRLLTTSSGVLIS